MSDEPLTEAVGDTQKALQAYAWSEVAEELPARKRRWPVIIAVLAFVAFAMAAVVGAVVLATPRPNVIVQPAPVAPPPPPPSPTPIQPVPAPVAPPTNDDSFVAALINHDASITETKIAISNAHGVCDELGQGMSRPDITDQVREAVSGYTQTRAAVFVTLSVTFYCPQYGVYDHQPA